MTDEIDDPRRWKKDGWIARVVKNMDDDGWAVEMTRVGDAEPALVSPWTMGRDKKNPKPLDHASFHTLKKTVTEVLRRHEHAARARLHRTFSCTGEDGRSSRARRATFVLTFTLDGVTCASPLRKGGRRCP